MSSGSVSDHVTVMSLLCVIVFPVLQGDGFDEAKCEIPSPVEPLHAGAYRSYPLAHSCFSCVACDILALKTLVKPGTEFYIYIFIFYILYFYLYFYIYTHCRVQVLVYLRVEKM